MKKFSAVFTIVEQKNCPLYDVEERLVLSDKTLACPEGKEVCLILVRDMTGLLFEFLQKQPVDAAVDGGKVYNCSGCTGLIKFTLIPPGGALTESSGEGAVAQIDSAVERKYGRIIDSPFLRTFPPDRIDTILDNFKEIVVEQDGILIRKGEMNLNLYIIFDGQLSVMDGGIHLATLSEGALCGEMSYLGADIALSTVVAVKKTRVLAMGGDVFGRLLGNCQPVQSYMAQFLAQQLRKTNAARARDLESSMSGRVDEVVPAELFQIFHMHQKTGVLSLDLPMGSGKVSFREGCIINASYGGMLNQEAIFSILAEKKGLYRFTSGLSPSEMRAAEIGDFMMLLMEGVKRVDEDQEQ